MRKVGVGLVLAACVAAACSSGSTGVSPDGIDGAELAAVRSALGQALASDSFYSELSTFVFPFIDRATKAAEGSGDTTRLVGILLDISATKGDTPVVARFTGLLDWRHYRAATQTVDTITFLLGAGITPPFTDSLKTTFSPDSAGTGVGFVLAQATDSVLQTWLTRTGAFHVSSASFGSTQTTSLGSLQLSVSHGTMSGDFHLTAKLVPDSSTSVSGTRSFSGGIQAVKIAITGKLAAPPAPAPTR
ncbi:MAG TPA: hypothetical protein VH163_04880 [Gemmatimonadales bacterium]|nr:hypothetical protein [Gemmatimonadales bacterium]